MTQVDVYDQTGADSPAQVTSCSCLGGAAWHYNDNAQVPSAQRTGDQYPRLRPGRSHYRPGTGPRYRDLYTCMRGMNGDNNGSGGTKTVTTTDPNNDPAVTDHNYLAGQVLEADTCTAASRSAAQAQSMRSCSRRTRRPRRSVIRSW